MAEAVVTDKHVVDNEVGHSQVIAAFRQAAEFALGGHFIVPFLHKRNWLPGLTGEECLGSDARVAETFLASITFAQIGNPIAIEAGIFNFDQSHLLTKKAILIFMA